ARLGVVLFDGSMRWVTWIPGVVSTLAVMMAVASCGKSTQTIAPDVGVSAKSGESAAPSAGLPSAKFAFSTSSLALIKQTSGTNGVGTGLSAPLHTPPT